MILDEFKKNYIQTLTTAAQVHKSRKNKKQLKQTSKVIKSDSKKQ